jgi:tetratricopeptide (TPR) repeat protein
MPETLTESEKAQLEQTIEMFEVIAQSQPNDYQSLEILKEAYSKLGRDKDAIFTAKRIAQAYIGLGQLTSAILEFESILQKYPNDEEARKALENIENQTTSNLGPAEPEEVAAPAPKKLSIKERAEMIARGEDPNRAGIDDGKAGMERLLVENKLISSGDFNMYWTSPADSPDDVVEPFLQILADKGLVTLDESLKLLCEKARLALLPIERYDVDVELARSFPKELCRRWCVLPFDRMSKSIFVATANPFNKQAIADLQKVNPGRVIFYLAQPPELIKAIKKVHR